MSFTPVPSKDRLLKLAQLTANIFHRAYNPTGQRVGGKILRKQLIGPAIIKWYPRQLIPFRRLRLALPEVELVDAREKQRLLDAAQKRKRGKGPPKKGQGKRAKIAARRKK
ncbi:13906_t:CDS:2 [Ambispora leptoticha]|uniref:Small ribosomal subunit protein mS33 n=1 Tax=Ambispora leptoticha TaxID=144679 RepID=A0A9N9AIN6_9GLOM|nr:13906_t:CDS:2 [Ambispora leptoticha]